MLKAVVFDLDGTLLNTIPDIAGALNRALESCGFPTHSVETCKAFVGGGIFQAIRQALPAGCGEEDVLRVHRIYGTYYPEHCAEETNYYPGVREMLRLLEERGVQLGVLSNKTESITQKVVDNYFPDVPFRCVFGRVDDRPLKPDAAAGAPVLEALGLQPDEIAYVGDSGSDMVFARNAGMVAVAAPWGYRSREELVASGAQHVPATPMDILNIL